GSTPTAPPTSRSSTSPVTRRTARKSIPRRARRAARAPGSCAPYGATRRSTGTSAPSTTLGSSRTRRAAGARASASRWESIPSRRTAPRRPAARVGHSSTAVADPETTRSSIRWSRSARGRRRSGTSRTGSPGCTRGFATGRGRRLPGVAHPALAGARVDARGDRPLMARLLRAPLVHFLVLGGALLAVRGWLDPALPPRPRLVIHAADVARLAETWTEEHGAPPDAAAKQRLLDEAIDEEVLYREALARSFDRRDSAVLERLVRPGSFVGEETGQDRESLEREARRRGLAR